MPNHRVLRPLCLVCSLAIAFVVTANRPSDARPIYKKCFEIVYKDKLKSNKTTCAVCHSGDDKRKLNHYGKAIAEELGEKNVKDDEKIIAAIKAVAKKKCKSGEWGERLERGMAPCDCADQDTESYLSRQLNRAR